MSSNITDLCERMRTCLDNRTPAAIGFQRRVTTAVMVLLTLRENGDIGVLFERRALTLRRQPGEVSFPGGHQEPSDETEADTAIRETCEELGVQREHIQLLGPLDVLVTGSGLMVHPFVGFLHHPEEMNPNPAEVEEVFTLGLGALQTTSPAVYEITFRPDVPDDFPYHLIPGGRTYPWRAMKNQQVFYELEGRVVWGMTARILQHFLELLENV